MVKGQSSNYWSLYKGCSLNIFWPFCLKVASLGIMDAHGMYMTPSDFQFTWSKVKVKLLVLIPSAVYTISYDLLISIDSYELRSHYELQSIDMQHLKKMSLFSPSNQTDKTIASLICWTTNLKASLYICNPFEFCTRGGGSNFNLLVVENDKFQLRSILSLWSGL